MAESLALVQPTIPKAAARATTDSLSIRNQAEINRSASEAGKIDMESITPAEIDRYMNPRPDTPFPLEYAFQLLGDLQGKTVVDLGLKRRLVGIAIGTPASVGEPVNPAFLIAIEDLVPPRVYKSLVKRKEPVPSIFMALVR